MNFRLFTNCLFLVFISTVTAFAAEPKLTLYVPFDGSINAKIAGGNPQGKYGLATPPQFSDGIAGTGLASGGDKQCVTFDAAGNISPDQWTITFWVKGLKGAQWNGGNFLQGFWQLNGSQSSGNAGEILWFYRYMDRNSPWLVSRPNVGDLHWLLAPRVPEEQWHYWAVSWRKGSGAYLYLDGQLAGQSACQPPGTSGNIVIGQPENPYSPPAQNKIIDEFKIYDTALDAGAIARRYWQEGNFALTPELTVAPTRQKITIDGKINGAEWQDAAGFTGLMDPQKWNLGTPRTWGKITYDNRNLYLALHSDNPADVKSNPDNAVQYGFVKKDAVHAGPDVMNDDSFFLNAAPAGKLYSLFANSIGTIYDFSQMKGNNQQTAWPSSAQVKSTLGIDGWSLEAAIPLTSFGIDHIADGTSWRMNFGRVWKKLLQRTDFWSAGQRDANGLLSSEPELGTVHFSSKADAIIDLQQFNIAMDGRVTAEINASNPDAAPHELTAMLAAAGKTLQQEKITLQTNERRVINLTALPADANGGLVEVTVQSGTKVLFRQAAPMILERVGQLAMWKYPSSGQLRLGWVIQSAENPAALHLNATIKDAAGKTVLPLTVEHLPSLDGSAMMDVKSLAPGKYTLEVQVKNADNVLQQQTFPYEKQPLPSWLGNTLGISDTPPPPWTDVKVDKNQDAVSIWGRSYDYAGHLFPTQIVNQGKQMLAAPMQLVVQTDKTHSSEIAKADSQWTKTTATRASSLRSQTIGVLNVKNNSYTDFDGMTWTELTVAPQSAKVLLNGLTLEIPLKAQWAKLIRPYDDYLLAQTGALPDKGWTGKASSMPWIGNGDGGIQFFQETTVNWIGSKSIEVVPNGHGAVVLRIHLIDKSTTLEKPLQFAFGWITSPVKSAPKKSRDWRIIGAGGIVNDTTGTGVLGSYLQRAVSLNPDIRPFFGNWENWWWRPAGYQKLSDVTGPLPVPANNGRENAVYNYRGINIDGAPYGRIAEMGTDNPWFAQFGDEWIPNTSKFTPDTSLTQELQIATVSQSARSLRDFYLWGYNRLLTEGDVHALYFDVSRPIDDTNIYHDAGTKMPDGTIEPTRNILATRRVFQRIYTLMKEKHPDGEIFYHMSGEIMLPIDSFCDAMVDGENYTGMLDRQDNRGYEKVLSVDQFRAEYAPQNNFGPASIFLPEFERAGSITADEWKTLGYQHADYLLGLVLLHDSNIWWTYMPVDHLIQVYSAFDATGWNANWKFIPYWQQKYFSLPQGVYASLYQSPDDGKVLLVLMNTSGKDQEIDLPMALDKSTFTAAKAVYPEQKLNVQNGQIAVNVGNNNFNAMLLEK
jgi:hypothetical protein